MMKLFLLPAAILALSTAQALAADLGSDFTAPPAYPDAPAFTWTGPYAGIQGGGGWANGEFSGLGISASENADGGILGVFAGYNHQFANRLVIGLEGDVDYNWNENEIFGAKFGTEWAGSVRGRAGYAFDRALIYATAGWTATQGYVDIPGLGKNDEIFNGYTVGAGLDYAFTQNVFGRAEYRYNNYGEKKLQGFEVKFDQHILKAGIGVKF